MVKQVDEIPESVTEQRKSKRKMIRADIQEAVDKGILKFEFDGDYNYKYMAQYAREEADSVLEMALTKAWRNTHEPNEKGYWPRSPHYYDRHIRNIKYIKIHNIRCKDRNHVYCEIIPEAIHEMIEAHEKYLVELEERDKEREERERMRRIRNEE